MSWNEAEEETRVRQLLESAGPRPEVPAEDLAAIKTAFRDEWRSRYARPAGEPATGERAAVGRIPAFGGATDSDGAKDTEEAQTAENVRALAPAVPRRASRPWRALALAASLTLATVAAWWWWPSGPTPGPATAARVEALAGAVMVSLDDAAATRLELGSERPALAAGTVLETAGEAEGEPGRISLRLEGGSAVRLAAGSRVRLISDSVLRLDRGALYVDSGDGPRRGAPVEIRTAVGTATDIGTQFEVRLLETGDTAMRVRVREGRVEIADGERPPYSADPGDQVTLHADGHVEQVPIDSYGKSWAWVLEAAPKLDIEGLTVGELLAWTTRETGWRVRFEPPELEQSQASITFGGAIGDVAPEETATTVLPSAGLTAELREGTLVIRRAH